MTDESPPAPPGPDPADEALPPAAPVLDEPPPPPPPPPRRRGPPLVPWVFALAFIVLGWAVMFLWLHPTTPSGPSPQAQRVDTLARQVQTLDAETKQLAARPVGQPEVLAALRAKLADLAARKPPAPDLVGAGNPAERGGAAPEDPAARPSISPRCNRSSRAWSNRSRRSPRSRRNWAISPTTSRRSPARCRRSPPGRRAPIPGWPDGSTSKARRSTRCAARSGGSTPASATPPRRPARRPRWWRCRRAARSAPSRTLRPRSPASPPSRRPPWRPCGAPSRRSRKRRWRRAGLPMPTSASSIGCGRGRRTW